MLKLKKDNIVPLGNPMVANGQPINPPPMIRDNSPTSFNGEYQIKITGLPEGANDQIAINAAIKDLHTAGSLDRNQVSNGEVTFQELFDKIAKLEREDKMNKGRLDTIANITRYDI